MKSYLMSITGAVLISVFSNVILPEKWNKYIKVITGLIIISTIVSPLKISWDFDFNKQFKMPQNIEKTSEEYSLQLIKQELKKRVDEDIKKRIKEEFSKDITANCDIGVNANGEITGVEKIIISGDEISEIAIKRLQEIYAPKEVIVNGKKRNN